MPGLTSRFVASVPEIMTLDPELRLVGVASARQLPTVRRVVGVLMTGAR